MSEATPQNKHQNLMPLLTIFSAPKPFTNPHIATIQRNALQSWLHLGEDVEVFLVGEEEGMAQVAREFKVPQLAQVARNESGTPLVSSIFDLARQASSSPFLVYVNADILLMPDLVQAVRQINTALSTSSAGAPFLLIGQRWDMDITTALDFSAGWDMRLEQEIRRRGQLHPPAGSDYFAFPRQAFQEMPEFAIGRAGWDNWMIYHARQHGWLVIDGTPSVKIVHQNHDYSHLPGGVAHYDLEESQVNMKKAGGLAHMYTVLDTNRQLADGKIQPAPITALRTVRTLERVLMPKSGKMTGGRGWLARRFRRLRRRMERSA